MGVFRTLLDDDGHLKCNRTASSWTTTATNLHLEVARTADDGAAFANARSAAKQLKYD